MTSSTKRIYTVTGPSNTRHLVKASSQAQAIHAISGNLYTAKVATTVEVAELVSAGVKVIGHAPSVPESVGETV